MKVQEGGADRRSSVLRPETILSSVNLELSTNAVRVFGDRKVATSVDVQTKKPIIEGRERKGPADADGPCGIDSSELPLSS